MVVDVWKGRSRRPLRTVGTFTRQETVLLETSSRANSDIDQHCDNSEWPSLSSGAYFYRNESIQPDSLRCRKPISLISHSDVRYRGILAGIDPAASTIQLSNGASFLISLGYYGLKGALQYILWGRSRDGECLHLRLCLDDEANYGCK